MNVIAYKALLAAVALAMTQVKADSAPMKVVDFASGHDTQIESASMELITDAHGWDRLWRRHKGPLDLGAGVQSAEPTPEVDFKKNYALALFAGQASNVDSYELVETEPSKGDVEIVRLKPVMLPGSPAVLTTPYAILIVTHTKKPIHVQVPDGKDRWETVAKFVPPKGKVGKAG